MTTIEKTEIGRPLTFGNQTLLPIEVTSIQHDANGANCWCYCSKQLIALVVETPRGILAFDSDARQLTMRDLNRLAPDIGSHLNHYCQKTSARPVETGPTFTGTMGDR